MGDGGGEAEELGFRALKASGRARFGDSFGKGLAEVEDRARCRAYGAVCWEMFLPPLALLRLSSPIWRAKLYIQGVDVLFRHVKSHHCFTHKRNQTITSTVIFLLQTIVMFRFAVRTIQNEKYL